MPFLRCGGWQTARAAPAALLAGWLIAGPGAQAPLGAEDLLNRAPVEAVPDPSESAPEKPSEAQQPEAEPSPEGAPTVARPAASLSRLVKVPLPPAKPAGLGVEPAAPQTAETDTPAETDGAPEGANPPSPPAPAATPSPAAIPNLPQAASLPADEQSPALPLPPSMKDAQPPEPESDGEEEAASAGSYDKQVETVDIACVKPAVLEIVKRAGLFFRAVPIVTSGFRARGRRGSLHRRCMAVDFVVPGVSTQTLANYLRSQPDAGGVGTYCNTKSVHVDIGERRNWGYCGFHRTYFSLR